MSERAERKDREMARSEVEIHESQVRNTEFVLIEAIGGTRRERGAAIAAVVRAYGRPLKRLYISYDEMYGFNTGTTARYQVITY